MQLIKSSRESLLKPLTVVSGIIENHQTLPILSNVLIQKDGGDVTFTGSNLEIQIRTHASIGTDDENAEFTVAARKILDLVKVLPETDISVQMGNAKKGIAAEGASRVSRQITVKTESSRFTLQTLPAGDYPKFPEAEYTSRITLPASLFKYLLSMVHYAMAVQDIRFYLNGMHLTVKGDTISAAATDGRRLAYCEAKLEGAQAEQEIGATIPRKTITELRRLLPDSDDPVTVEFSEKQARFTFCGIELSTKLLEGRYPDILRVMPVNNDKQFLVNREQLLGALNRTAILTTDKFKGVRWLLSPGTLSVESSNSEQEEGSDQIAINYEGDTIDIGFNITFLTDVLNNLKNDEIKISLSGPQGSALITMPESDAFKYVLMPMRL